MIEGLKIEITSAALKASLDRRIEHHRGRAAFYDKQVAGMDIEGIAPQHVSNDPRSSMRSSAQHHAERAGFFAFIADHLVPSEIYRLSDSDLMRLELVAQYL